MQVRIELLSDNEPEEVIIRCNSVTSEVESLARMLRNFEAPTSMPVFFKGDEQYYLSLRELLFFETDEEKVYAHTADDAFEVRMRLYELETILPGFFVRVSRSAIVSILHVLSIQKGLTRVNLIAFRKSHKVVYGSRMYGKELFRKMNERYLYDNT
jgi:DNA-binding LytR/AlgR family response regulator